MSTVANTVDAPANLSAFVALFDEIKAFRLICSGNPVNPQVSFGSSGSS